MPRRRARDFKREQKPADRSSGKRERFRPALSPSRLGRPKGLHYDLSVARVSHLGSFDSSSVVDDRPQFQRNSLSPATNDEAPREKDGHVERLRRERRPRG
jgi:hypothetical protein